MAVVLKIGLGLLWVGFSNLNHPKLRQGPRLLVVGFLLPPAGDIKNLGLPTKSRIQPVPQNSRKQISRNI